MAGLMPIEEMVYWPESTLQLTSYLLWLVTLVGVVVLKGDAVWGGEPGKARPGTCPILIPLIQSKIQIQDYNGPFCLACVGKRCS